VLTSSRMEAFGQAYAILAMAKWRLGEKETAQAMLAKGNDIAPQIMPARDALDPGQSWFAWVFSRISLDEAAALFESNSNMFVPREIRDEGIGVIPLETHQRYPVGEIAKAVKSHSTTG